MKRPIVLFISTVFIIGSLITCGGGGGGGTGGPGNKTPPSMTKDIGTEGGIVSVTGLTGLKFSLSIPEGATDQITVTITALSGVEGFALSQNVIAAIRFEPNGLSFTKPAMLTITPPAGASFPANVIAFLFSGGEILPTAVTLQGGAAEVPVTHFSEVAIVDPANAIDIAQQTVQDQYDKFMEWTGAFLSQDWAYFEQPGRRFNHWPACTDARSVVNEAIGLVKMGYFLGDDPAIDINDQLVAVLRYMVDGPKGSNSICQQSGDDSLSLQCYAAVEWLSELTGMENWGAPKRCGASDVKAVPAMVQLDPGGSAMVTFTVRDMWGQPIARREVKVVLFPGSTTPDAVTMSVTDLDKLTVACNKIGWNQLRGFDNIALRYGYTGLYVDVPVLCSYSGISIMPARATVIGNDRAIFQVAVQDAAGNDYPLGSGIAISWTSYDSFIEVIPDPANSARASAGLTANMSGTVGTATIMACVGELSTCDLSIEAKVTIVPDLRGTWYGAGGFTAAGCQDQGDNGLYTFNDWMVSFTQTIDPLNAPASTIAGMFTGSGIGVRNLGPLTGTIGTVWDISGTAGYSSSDAGGSATFQGSFGDLTPGYESVELDFTYQDAYGDTCSGGGTVTFRRNPL